MKTLIKNALIINEGEKKSGSLLISDAYIEKIYDTTPQNLPSDIQIIDAKGKWLIPGVIDDQVHFREPGLTHKGDIQSESKAAIAGGITSFMDMPNVNPQTTTQKELQNKFDLAAQKSLANYSFYFGATNDNIEEIIKTDPKKVCGIKVFMGSSTGNMLVDKPKVLAEIFEKAPTLIATHCEDEATIIKNTEKYKKEFGDDIPFSFHPKIRSEEACFLSSSYAVQLAKKHNTRLHILHLSTAKELELFTNIPLEEKKITAEVCIHHLWFSQEDYEKKGSHIKWNPAIKTKNDRNALLQALKDNKLDVIATDHAPHLLNEKNNSYFKTASGGPMVQHSLVSMLELAKQDKITVETVIEKMCHAPAKLFKIEKRGFIREGYFADLVLIDPNKKWTVNKDNILYKCKWSPMEGISFNHQITHTFINGNLSFENGKIDFSFRGQALRFKN